SHGWNCSLEWTTFRTPFSKLSSIYTAALTSTNVSAGGCPDVTPTPLLPLCSASNFPPSKPSRTSSPPPLIPTPPEQSVEKTLYSKIPLKNKLISLIWQGNVSYSTPSIVFIEGNAATNNWTFTPSSADLSFLGFSAAGVVSQTCTKSNDGQT